MDKLTQAKFTIAMFLVAMEGFNVAHNHKDYFNGAYVMVNRDDMKKLIDKILEAKQILEENDNEGC